MKFAVVTIATVLGAAVALSLTVPAPVARAEDAAAKAPPAALRSCSGCHDVGAGKKRMGPSLVGLYGAKPAKAAIKIAKWDDKSLDSFLEDPAKLDATSKMKVKTKDAKKRADIIAALKTLK